MHKILFRKQGKRPLGRPMNRWKDNIKAALRQKGCYCLDWTELSHIGSNGRHM